MCTLFSLKPSSSFLILFLLVLALLPKVWGLSSKGLFGYDESYLLGFCRSAVSVAGEVWKQREGILRGERSIAQLVTAERARAVAMPAYLGVKPGHAAIICISVAVLTPVDYAGAWAMALFSVGSMYLVYLIGQQFYGSSVGVLSALILAVDPFLMAHARTGKEIADTQFFFLLTLLLFLRGWQLASARCLFIAGVVAGLLLSINYVAVLALGLLGLASLIGFRPNVRVSSQTYVKSYAIFIAGLSFPVMLFVALTALAARMIPDIPIFLLPGSGFVQPSISPFRVFRPLYYWQAYQISEGVVWILLLLLASVVVGWRLLRSRQMVDASLLLLAPGYLLLLGLLTPHMFVVPRSAMIVVPVAAILIAVGVVNGAHWGFDRLASPLCRVFGFALVGFTACLLVMNTFRSLHLINLHSGYREAASWLRSHGGGRVESLHTFPMMDFYLGDRSLLYFSKSLSQESLCSAFYQGQVRYLLVDWYDMAKAASLDLPAPKAVIPNPIGNEPIYTIEASSSLNLHLAQAANPIAGEIRIYDLAAFKCSR
jgi:4-amino-4-deoxy-L-arabinose transferase-like glycosyltransferase